jgi:hypothetical protein
MNSISRQYYTLLLLSILGVGLFKLPTVHAHDLSTSASPNQPFSAQRTGLCDFYGRCYRSAPAMYGLVGGGNEYEQPYLFPSYPFPGLIVVRPASCGKYRYWNGERCVDARYQPPYVGPRW